MANPDLTLTSRRKLRCSICGQILFEPPNHFLRYQQEMPSTLLEVYQTVLHGKQQSLNMSTPTIGFKDFEVIGSDILTIFDHSRPLGISPGYDANNGKLVYLAVADDKNCRVVQFQHGQEGGRGAGRNRLNATPPPPPQTILDARAAFEDKILCRPIGDIYAFDMGPLAMSLYLDLGIRIIRAIDIQSAFSATDRNPLSAITAAFGDESLSDVKISNDNIKALFSSVSYDMQDRSAGRNRLTDLSMRAWISQFLPAFENGETTFEKVPRIDTKKLLSQRLDMIAKIANDSLRLDQKKPGQTNHQFTQSIDAAGNQVQLNSTNFNTRLRGQRDVRMKVNSANGEYFVNSTIDVVMGRSGNLNTDRVLTNKTITTVTSIGRDDPTLAEAQRAATVLCILQGSEKLLDESPWIQNIWFPSDDGLLMWPAEWSNPLGQKPNSLSIPARDSPAGSQSLDQPQLNPSQQQAVNSMLSEKDDHRITVIQGPPGTGKTSVIASFVNYAVNTFGRNGIWLVAQSNVAVKNIAEKLIKTKFPHWKLLVSKDFVFDWHEHIYGEVANHVIRSDEFNHASNKANLRGTHVILCTLSMLANNSITRFTKEIPLKVLVVDEASQIEIGNYVTVFSKFKSTLRKTCFIGDDKQLPPFGQEDLQDLQSIFEVSHLRNKIVFLDTQYRMPPQIGQIISDAVYDGKLKSNPNHPITNKTIACHFMDVSSKEKQLLGGSFRNDLECEAVLCLAQKLQEQEKKYKIISPYAAQTTWIEQSMKDKGLAWEDKCFNVDSFQGNEEDFIIISIVRTRSLGFLTNLRRTNVMLSRCKKGMFIVSSRTFLKGPGEDTLVGEFLKKMEPAVWLTPQDIEAENF